MARSSRNPARLVIALAIASVLAIFLVYTSLHGSTPALQPSNLDGHGGTISLTGKVTGRVTGDANTSGLHFSLRDINDPTKSSPIIPIIYHGQVPDLFKSGRDVNLTGRLEGKAFVATQLTTKCPSKYAASTKA
ncbi:MAG: cytochrome c maturation protein CcmE [Actinomycetes bacterium]